ncbi:MAG: class I SAM-dependent methyltransferase [Proteobacteria bacterium]|nr:class I SAM-dependent methyltransferase [Pseudomonadota bacterium]
MKNIINYSFFFIFLFFHSSLLAGSTADLKKWVPQTLHSPKVLKQLADEINAEAPRPIPLDPSPIKKDYGFDFPHVSHALEKVLIEIKTRYERTGIHPVILDAGAGTGTATWKMIIAGGQAFPLELNRAAATQLLTRLRKVKAYLNVPPKDLCPAVYIDTVMNFESKAYARVYDITYSGNLIHFLSPEDAQSYVKQLFKVTKPGGVAVATTNAPSYIPCVFDLWRKNRDQGNPFPGYMIKDQEIIRCGYSDGSERNVAINILDAHSPKNNDLYPGTERDGFYSDPQDEIKWEPLPSLTTNDASYFVRNAHSALHFFDTETLSKLFSDAGFTVTKAYYFSGDDEKIFPEAMTDEQLKEKIYNSVVEAYKPDIE